MNSNDTVKTRGAKKRDYLKHEKWARQIKTQSDQSTWSSSNETDSVRENSRKFNNLISNPKKIEPLGQRPRSRTESSPPKSKRSDCGINRGKPGGCSTCRPKIHKRMYETAGLRSYVRKIKNLQTGSLILDSDDESYSDDGSE